MLLGIGIIMVIIGLILIVLPEFYKPVGIEEAGLYTLIFGIVFIAIYILLGEII